MQARQEFDASVEVRSSRGWARCQGRAGTLDAGDQLSGNQCLGSGERVLEDRVAEMRGGRLGRQEEGARRLRGPLRGHPGLGSPVRGCHRGLERRTCPWGHSPR